MAIKGLTDRIEPRLPIIGKLRKGGAKPEVGYGKDLKHFRFTSDDPAVQAAFTKAYGETPVSLPIYLPLSTVDGNFQTAKEKWVAGGLVHRCDGETMNLWLGDDHKFHQTPKPCPYKDLTQSAEEAKRNPPCKAVARLTVILPRLWQQGYVGLVTMETHSLNDILTISSTLMAIYEARASSGGLQGIEYTLFRAPRTISVPGEGGKRRRMEKWLVGIAPSASWVQLQLEAMHVEGLPALMAGPARAEVVIEGEDEPEDDEDEVGPEIVEGEIVNRPTTETPTSTTETAEPGTPSEPSSNTTSQDGGKATPHWYTDAKKKAIFLRAAGRLKLKGPDIMAAFGVAKISEFTGTLEEALAILEGAAAIPGE